jgi:hypothetical protein
MNPEIVNMYIERLLKEVEELTKSRLLIETQLRYTEKMNSDLQTSYLELQSQFENATNKTNKKEVSTSEVL